MSRGASRWRGAWLSRWSRPWSEPRGLPGAGGAPVTLGAGVRADLHAVSQPAYEQVFGGVVGIRRLTSKQERIPLAQRRVFDRVEDLGHRLGVVLGETCVGAARE